MTHLDLALGDLFLLAAKVGDGIDFEGEGSLPGKGATGCIDDGVPSLDHAVSPGKM